MLSSEPGETKINMDSCLKGQQRMMKNPGGHMWRYIGAKEELFYTKNPGEFYSCIAPTSASPAIAGVFFRLHLVLSPEEYELSR